MMKTISATPPPIKLVKISGEVHPYWRPSNSPNVTPPSAAVSNSNPGRSIRPASDSSYDSFAHTVTSKNARMASGILIPKINQEIIDSLRDNNVIVSISLYKPTEAICKMMPPMGGPPAAASAVTAPTNAAT